MDTLLVLIIAIILFYLWRNYNILTNILKGESSVIVDSSYPYYSMYYPPYGGYGRRWGRGHRGRGRGGRGRGGRGRGRGGGTARRLPATIPHQHASPPLRR